MSASITMIEKQKQDNFFKVFNKFSTTAQITIIVIMACIIFFFPVVKLTYLGASFDSKTEFIPTDDWRRKVIIFEAWFTMVTSSLLLALAMTKISFTMTFMLFFLKMLVNILFTGIALSYLGTTFSTSEKQLKTNDWRRKATVLYGYYSFFFAAQHFGYEYLYKGFMSKTFG